MENIKTLIRPTARTGGPQNVSCAQNPPRGHPKFGAEAIGNS